jgi:3-oxoacyl-[acyl-carrier-protein] synthase III
MGLFSIANCRLAGVSACAPLNTYNNADYEHLSVAEREMLIKTTGVARRRIAQEGTTSADLAYRSALHLLQTLHWEPSEVELLLLVTQTGDYLMPATSRVLQHRLGLSRHCMTIDINSGCSGFVDGLATAAALVSASGMKKALLLTAEVPSRYTSPQDKSTFPLFGDAAAAIAIEFDAVAPLLFFNLQTDGSGFDAIMIPDGGMRSPVHPTTSFLMQEIAPGIERNRLQLALDGIKVFNFSLREVAPNIRELFRYAGKDLNQADFFIFHQANLLIIDSVRKKLGLEKERFPISLDRFGNTSSASIPLTLVTELAEAIRNGRKQLLFAGFGVGLAWGSCLAEVNQVCVPDLLEV